MNGYSNIPKNSRAYYADDIHYIHFNDGDVFYVITDKRTQEFIKVECKLSVPIWNRFDKCQRCAFNGRFIHCPSCENDGDIFDDNIEEQSLIFNEIV